MATDHHQPFADTAEWLTDRYRRAGFHSDRNAATHLNVERTTLRKYLDGDKVPPDEIVLRLTDYFKDDPAEMLALAGRSRIARRAGAGTRVSLPANLVDQLAEQVAERVGERVLAQVRELLGTTQEDEMATILQRAGVEEPASVDDRLPVLFSGVIWEELTDAEKAGVIALAKRLMGRPQGKTGRRSA